MATPTEPHNSELEMSMGFLEDTFKRLAEMASSVRLFDPASLNDDVALETDWDAMSRGGVNFAMYRLVEVSPRRFEFRVTAMTLFVPAALMLTGGW